MSRRKIDEAVPATVRKRTIMTCDLCGIETKPGGDWPTKESWEMPDTEIIAKIGDVFPEGDMRTYYRLDVCPTCFVEVFVPKVEKALGVKFSTGDVEE